MLPYLLITSSGSGTKVCFNTTKALAVYQPTSIVPPKEGMGVVGEQYEYKVSKNIRPLHTLVIACRLAACEDLALQAKISY